MSTLFLNIVTLLAVTQSVDNLFYSLIVLCENEPFFQRFEEASVERLHLMGAVWRKSDQLDSVSPGIVYTNQDRVAVMPVQHNHVTVLR